MHGAMIKSRFKALCSQRPIHQPLSLLALRIGNRASVVLGLKLLMPRVFGSRQAGAFVGEANVVRLLIEPLRERDDVAGFVVGDGIGGHIHKRNHAHIRVRQIHTIQKRQLAFLGILPAQVAPRIVIVTKLG